METGISGTGHFGPSADHLPSTDVTNAFINDIHSLLSYKAQW